MGRKKVLNKNVNVSVSIERDQRIFLERHPNFNLSRFVQIYLSDYIQLSNIADRIEREAA